MSTEPPLNFNSAAPLFRRYFWPEQDLVTRTWIASIAERIPDLALVGVRRRGVDEARAARESERHCSA
jgi:hypothetical protein